jgi:hypothetical protein
VAAEQSPVRAELDRVGASFRKAGAANYITVSEDEDAVRLVGPPGERPRRYWTGSAWQLLELLACCRTTRVCKPCGGRCRVVRQIATRALRTTLFARNGCVNRDKAEVALDPKRESSLGAGTSNGRSCHETQTRAARSCRRDRRRPD